ncbi:Ketosamine-3-kinase-like protein [Leptotrombidium deliense]|uniref:protein-ribulosamine 3-kinase n=1 Tax=Leptotrombidium deliense TaxID=299467 RepID=A0A443RVR8_9ACAR|nr:Ketosamine-3-kinase-like protein [Leptotrombidium deliense]
MAATKTVRVPKAYFAISDHQSTKSAIVMEYIANMKSLSKGSQKLGESLANLHLHNINLGKRLSKQTNWVGKGRDENNEFISEFGFHCATCCGSIPMVNEWHNDWVAFYARFRLEDKVNGVLENCGDRELRELWSKLQIVIPNFFKDCDDNQIVPSLLHGDLWSGNAGETDETPVIFDPSSFYGHSEFDLAIARVFGGFGRRFFDAYHSVIKKASFFDKRCELYELFHYLNHWQHFGNSYRSQSINIMKRLCKS